MTCGVSSRTIDNWMKRGVIPYLKIGSLVRFDPVEIEKALRRFTITSTKTTTRGHHDATPTTHDSLS